MTLVQMFDAAYPPAAPYPGCAAVAGYIGGNTPHTWARAEWGRFRGLAQLPIWVGYQEGNPVLHAGAAAVAARSLGWRAFHQPEWRAIVLDREAELDEPWIAAFGHELQREGFLCWPYNSYSVLAAGGDPPGYSIWLPTWNDVRTVPPYPNVVAAQFAHDVAWDGTHVDLSVVESAVLGSFGYGPRQ